MCSSSARLVGCQVYGGDLFGRCCRMNGSEYYSLLSSGCTISMLKNLSHEETHLPCSSGGRTITKQKNKCPMVKQVSRGRVYLEVREGHKARQEDSGLRQGKVKRNIAGIE